MRRVFALVAAVLVAGCESAVSTGEGPLALSPGVLAEYENFKRLDNPGYFAVPPDGSTYGYSFCADTRCRGHSPGVALWSCNQNRDADDCRIYAYRTERLWRYPSEWTPPAGFSAEVAAATLPAIAMEVRLVAAPGRTPGRLHMAPDLAYGGLSWSGLPTRGACSGVLQRTHAGGGMWEATCMGGQTVAGLFYIEEAGRAVRGFSVGDTGRRLEFTARLPGRP